MSLKKSIVIVNEYTIKNDTGTGGSRGGTPGQYVTRYMAREGAVESLTPVTKFDSESFIMRYFARDTAVDTNTFTVPDARGIKQKMLDAQGFGGVGFGYGQLSLSDESMRKASKDIQQLFEQGHTVLKTVLSFDQQYLKDMKVVPEDLEIHEPGDYKGNFDQLKLRMAIMNGLDRLARTSYDDLRYVGVIQVDTEHVHCHLAMVDAGQGTIMNDGTQRGKIWEAGKSFLRRGIDDFLDEYQTMRVFNSAAKAERQNVATFVKKWSYQRFVKESVPQLLLACLPEDTNLWRASSNRAEMRKPNAIVYDMVMEIFDDEKSPYAHAMNSVVDYATARGKRENLTEDEINKIIDRGQKQLVESSMNAVYTILKRIPRTELSVRTPILDVMSEDYEDLLRVRNEKDDLAELREFSFKLRTFTSRRDYHKKQREDYHTRINQWEEANRVGVADPASVALRDFFAGEEEYHAMCFTKYQYFLDRVPFYGQWEDEWDTVCDYGEKLIGLEGLMKDPSIAQMRDRDAAEEKGREVYGQPGGKLISGGPDQRKAGMGVLRGRLEKMKATYETMVRDLKMNLSLSGLQLSYQDDYRPGDVITKDNTSVAPGKEYEFHEVRGMDMHHMKYDFMKPVTVAASVSDRFSEVANKRKSLCGRAIAYLEGSGQTDAVKMLPLKDIELMNRVASEVTTDHVLGSEFDTLLKTRKDRASRRKSTIRIDRMVSEELSNVVRQTAQNYRFDIEDSRATGGKPRGLAE